MRRRAVPAFRPRRRRSRWWIGFVVLFAVLIIGAGVLLGGGYWYLAGSLPQREGTVYLNGLRSEVRVYWDERGVPHIEASYPEDLFYAQGYVTAQDRLWQMDIYRRVAAGRMAEILGESQLEQDKFFRTLGFRQAAEASVAAASPEALQMAEAYAAGVTAYIEHVTGTRLLPIEFRLLGYEPEPWTVVDTLLIARLMAYYLSGNWALELQRYLIAEVVGWDVLHEWLPEYPGFAPTITTWAHMQQGQLELHDVPAETQELPDRPGQTPEMPVEEPPTQLPLASLNDDRPPARSDSANRQRLQALLELAPAPFLGSNSWALSPDKTATGGALLANDPHMQFGIPALWHQIHLVLENDFNAMGISVPGVPGVVFGRNEHIAWAITSLMADSQDLFIQRPNPDNPREFLYQGRWEPAAVREELIYVKGRSEPVFYEVLETARHGPVLNPVLEDEVHDVLSIRWTALGPTREINALPALLRARTFEEFEAALDLWDMPALSMLYADAQGNIGYKATGLLPLRPAGAGRYPVPAWTGEYDWLGTIPKSEMPRAYNPDSGFIVTANNAPADADFPHYIGDEFDPWRALRITEVLAAGSHFTPDDMRTLQLDVVNTHARWIAPLLIASVEDRLLGALQPDETEIAALRLLQQWDFSERADAPQPLLWHLWRQELHRIVLRARFGFDVGDQLLLDHVLLRMQPIEREEVVTVAFRAAVRRAVALQGDDPSRWEWGRWHRMTVYHPVGESVPVLGWLFNVGDWPIAGSGKTPYAAGFDSGGLVDHGASWRVVVDWATGVGRDVLLPGNSGHVLSPWYQDQAETWLAGQLLEQQFQPEQYRRGTLLRLVPR